MISKMHCFYTDKLDLNLTPTRIAILQKLVSLVFEDCVIDDQSDKAKQLMKYNVVTLKYGNSYEHYNYFELVTVRLPPILFSNNLRFMRRFRANASNYLGLADPLDLLVDATRGYYRKIKKIQTPLTF